MTINTDITKQDLLNMIDRRLNYPFIGETRNDYVKLQEYVQNEFDESEPINLSFEGEAVRKSARSMLVGIILQGIHCYLAKNQPTPKSEETHGRLHQ